MNRIAIKLSRSALLVLTAPLFLGWLFPLAMLCVFAARGLRLDSDGVLSAVWRPWAARLWPYSTTLSRGIVYQPDARSADKAHPTSTEDHEQVHVRQAADRCLLALVVAVVVGGVSGCWWLALGLWLSGGLWQLPNMLAGALRYGASMEGFYYSTEHERSARAQTGRWCGGKGWLAHDRQQQEVGRG